MWHEIMYLVIVLVTLMDGESHEKSKVPNIGI